MPPAANGPDPAQGRHVELLALATAWPGLPSRASTSWMIRTAAPVARAARFSRRWGSQICDSSIRRPSLFSIRKVLDPPAQAIKPHHLGRFGFGACGQRGQPPMQRRPAGGLVSTASTRVMGRLSGSPSRLAWRGWRNCTVFARNVTWASRSRPPGLAVAAPDVPGRDPFSSARFCAERTNCTEPGRPLALTVAYHDHLPAGGQPLPRRLRSRSHRRDTRSRLPRVTSASRSPHPPGPGILIRISARTPCSPRGPASRGNPPPQSGAQPSPPLRRDKHSSVASGVTRAAR